MRAKRNGVVVRDYQRTMPDGVALRISPASRWLKATAAGKVFAARVKTPQGRAKQRLAERRYQASGKGNVAKANRRARERAALIPLTPADHLRITSFYAEAARRTAETGIAHHVDHDVPLALGGKHHPDNLLVVPAAINLAKGAKYASTWDFISS